MGALWPSPSYIGGWILGVLVTDQGRTRLGDASVHDGPSLAELDPAPHKLESHLVSLLVPQVFRKALPNLRLAVLVGLWSLDAASQVFIIAVHALAHGMFGRTT